MGTMSLGYSREVVPKLKTPHPKFKLGPARCKVAIRGPYFVFHMFMDSYLHLEIF